MTVGGSGVGGHLLRRVIEAYPEAKERVPGLRMSWSPGRASTRQRCRSTPGSRSAPYVHDLYRHLAACDLAVVQGGLTTSMELTANRRPFLYFPLGHHFEQNFHVHHRLGRYGAGRRMDYATASPRRSPRPSPRRSAARSATARWRPTAPHGPPTSSPSCSSSRCWSRPSPSSS